MSVKSGTVLQSILLASTLCASCVTTVHRASHHYEDHVDLSDSANGSVATIRGSERALLGLLGEYCWLESPGKAKRVTVNAGMVDVVAVCEARDELMLEGSTYSAAFHFDAFAGHEYEIGMQCDGCLRLRDVTTEEVIAESPYLQIGEFQEDLSTSDHTAIIMGGGCWLTDGEATSLVVDAGPINIDVTCRVPRLMLMGGYTRLTSSFDFDAETGHTYMFWDVSFGFPFGDKCLSLFDRTSKMALISCEPYKKVE